MTDDILQRIQNDIDRCRAVAAAGDKAAARALSGELISTYKGTIKHFSMGLTEFSYFEVANFIKDILTLSRKLEAYAATLNSSARDVEDTEPEPEPAGTKQETQQGSAEYPQPMAEKKASKEQEIEELLNSLKNRIVEVKGNDKAYLKKIEEIELSYRKQISQKERWAELKDVIIWSAGLQPDIGCDVLKLVANIYEK